MSPTPISRRMLLSGTAMVAAPHLAAAQDQRFPNHPIRFIVPFGPGGPSDASARGLARVAGRVLGQTIVVENRPGAAGTLGPVGMAQRDRPDGYTISQMVLGVFRYPAMTTVNYDPVEDFSWIIRTSGNTFYVGVRADAPWRSWQDLIADAKARPGAISYSSNGIGGTPHLTMSRILEHDGADMLHVPFRGWADAATALLGGQVQVMADTGPWAPLVEAGQARVLVNWSPQRSRQFPDVPTLMELGYGIVSDSPWGIAGPKGMPPEIVRILHDALHTALQDPEYLALLENLGQSVAYLSSADYAAYARRTAAEEREQIQKLGIRM